MKTSWNLQDSYLNTLRRERVALTVFLTNGFQLRGVVRSFDEFTVLLEVEGRHNLVYKHAISTVSPCRNVEYSGERNCDET